MVHNQVSKLQLLLLKIEFDILQNVKAIDLKKMYRTKQFFFLHNLFN